MKKIIVADDEELIRRLVSDFLTAEGYEPLQADDGDVALKLFEENPDTALLILDIMMPNMDGYEFTEMLRSVNDTMPVLMISAKQLPDDRRRGFLAGTDDYMTKPVDEQEMLLRIKALLRRARIVNEKKITVGDAVLDYESLTVSRKDETVFLPQKEFQLLYMLLSYPGKIFTRIQLMDEIWGPECETGWETVTVHIARLRKRFENWDEFSIESVRGLGYRAVKKV